jgi:hypothetical protein
VRQRGSTNTEPERIATVRAVQYEHLSSKKH